MNGVSAGDDDDDVDATPQTDMPAIVVNWDEINNRINKLPEGPAKDLGRTLVVPLHSIARDIKMIRSRLDTIFAGMNDNQRGDLGDTYDKSDGPSKRE